MPLAPKAVVRPKVAHFRRVLYRQAALAEEHVDIEPLRKAVGGSSTSTTGRRWPPSGRPSARRPRPTPRTRRRSGEAHYSVRTYVGQRAHMLFVV